MFWKRLLLTILAGLAAIPGLTLHGPPKMAGRVPTFAFTLAGHAPDMRADVYSAGLVLFELLGDGDLFAPTDRREQLRARMTTEPVLEGRVPPPLSSVLARMLARDPSKRYRDASEALSAVIDLDTALGLDANVLAPKTYRVFRTRGLISPQRWEMTPKGQHIELGIAEMNLFLLLRPATSLPGACERNTNDHMPGAGNSTSATLRKLDPDLENNVSKICFIVL